MTLKVRILQSLRRLFIILVGLMMTLFSEKMLISNVCISGLMPNLIKKSWTVSTPHSPKTRTTTIKMWNPETIIIFPLVLDDPPWLLLVLEML